MKLAFSNLAWEPKHDADVATVLKAGGVSGVEIAPSKIWKEPTAVSAADATAYRRAWEKRGLPIVALQSLLFGKPDLRLFGDEARRDALAEYLEKMFVLAERLGAKVLVFGSPRNRLKGNLSPERALEIAIPFFQRVGQAAAQHGVILGLEANARKYACDFIVTTDEAADLVDRVATPGFGLHGDWGCMELEGENVLQAVETHRTAFRHFHLSTEALQPIINRKRDQVEAIVDIFNRLDLPPYASVEMLNPEGRTEVIAAVLKEIGPAFGEK